jgi:hypothetical protein
MDLASFAAPLITRMPYQLHVSSLKLQRLYFFCKDLEFFYYKLSYEVYYADIIWKEKLHQPQSQKKFIIEGTTGFTQHIYFTYKPFQALFKAEK